MTIGEEVCFIHHDQSPPISRIWRRMVVAAVVVALCVSAAVATMRNGIGISLIKASGRSAVRFDEDWQNNGFGWDGSDTGEAWQNDDSGWAGSDSGEAWQNDDSGWDGYDSGEAWQNDDSGWDGYDSGEAWQNDDSGGDGSDSGEAWQNDGFGDDGFRGSASLFCWAVVRTWLDDEKELVQKQWENHVGMFACDATSVLSVDPWTVGEGPDAIEAMVFEYAEAGQSDAGSSANTLLFIHAWDTINAARTWDQFAWTVKVDPDSVLLADRLRNHLEPLTGQAVFIHNCAEVWVPNQDPGPLMYGSIEVLSHQALEAYFNGKAQCDQELNWGSWGEDVYMTRCLQSLNVYGHLDADIAEDSSCQTTYDCLSGRPAYHPKKVWWMWSECWNQATGVQLRL